jgi:hypothetical protein
MTLESWSGSLAGVLCVALALDVWAAGGADPVDVIRVVPEEDKLVLFWEDSETALRGTMVPVVPRVGEPLRVTLRIRALEGKPFKGQVMLTLRGEREIGGPTEKVEPQAGIWAADFVPRVTGPHVLDVSFRTTRPKLLHARFEVGESQFPRAAVWAVGAAIALVAAVLGARRIVRSSRFLRQT